MDIRDDISRPRAAEWETAATPPGREAEGGEPRGVTGLTPEERARRSSLSPPTFDEPPGLSPAAWVSITMVGIAGVIFTAVTFFFFGWAVAPVAVFVLVVVVVVWVAAKALTASQREPPRTTLGRASEGRHLPRP